MQKGIKSTAKIRFAEFEADISAGELYRSDKKVKLQQQPFQILAVLLQHPGALVTRDELRERIWPAGTFVDFERGVNKAVNRLREALGDSAEKPRFIETVPGRGYRFIAKSTSRFRSIAVLPFENLSGDSGQEYWADGVTDELTTQLARIADLRVVSRTSAMQFKNSKQPLAEMASLLGVDAILQGSVVTSSERVRIRVQLIDPVQDRHLWVECFDRALSDIVTLQTEIANAIARRIERQVEPSTFEVEKRAHPAAYEAYLMGHYFLTKGTGVEKSQEHFKRAIDLQPDYAPAYAGLADTYILLGVLYLNPPHDTFPKAKQYAEKALQLNEALAEAHKSLASVMNLYDWNFQGAERHFMRALELNPSLSSAHQGYSVLLTCLRRYEEAISEILKARELDPLSVAVNAFVGFIYMRARRFCEALGACRHAIELDPNNPFAHWMFARTLDAAEEVSEALVESRLAAAQSGNCAPYSSHVGYALARTGDREGASEVLRRLGSERKTRYVSPYEVAMIYVALGESDLAFEWLNRAYEERTSRLSAELWDHSFDPLRKDSRFQDLLRRIGLPS